MMKNLLIEANIEERRVAKFIAKLGELGSNLRIARMRAQGSIKSFLQNITEDDYALFLYRPDLEQFIFPTPNFKHIITVKTPTEVLSLPIKNEIKKLVKRGVLAKDIGLRMLFFENRELALEAFQTTKNEVYANMNNSVKEESKPCWKGYQMVGMKNKNGKQVPNCVPISEVNSIQRLSEGDTDYELYFKKMLRRTGKSSPAEMDDREKRIFFMKLDRGWQSREEPKKETEKETKKENTMILTVEERRFIAKKVIESNRKTISEAKSNSKIKRQIKLNLEFYSGMKEAVMSEKKVLQEGLLYGIYKFFGVLGKILTAVTFLKFIVDAVKNWWKKTIGPTAFGQKVEGWIDKLKGVLKKVSEIIGPKGIAFLIALFKYKGRPTPENIEKELPLAKKIFVGMLVIIVCFSIYSLVMWMIPLLTTTLASSTPLASLWGMVTNLGAVEGFSTAAITAYGIPSKMKKIKENMNKTGQEIHDEGLVDEIKAEGEAIVDTAEDELAKDAGSVADDKPPKESDIPPDVKQALEKGDDIEESRRFKLKSISESALRKNRVKQKRKK